MKFSLGVVLALALTQILVVHAEELPAETIARQGEAELSVAEFGALSAEIPPTDRSGFASDPERLTLLVKNGLLTKQLAARALSEGKVDQKAIEDALLLHRTRLIAAAYMDTWRKTIEFPPFDRMAEEQYLAKPEQFLKPAEVDIRYILFNIEGRTEAEALAKANEIGAKAKAGEDFGKLVLAHTEEPKGTVDDAARGSASNLAVTTANNPFNRAVGKLKVGEVSEAFIDKGHAYVVLVTGRRDAMREPFEAAKPKLVEQLRTQYETDQVNALLSEIRDGEVEFNEAILPTLRDGNVEAK